MTQWTEQPDGTWRRGPLVVGAGFNGWSWWIPGTSVGGHYRTREVAQAAADAWAANMLAQLKELEE